MQELQISSKLFLRSIIMNIKKINIEKLKPAKYNPRKDLTTEDEEYKEILKALFNNKMHKRLKYTLIETVKRGICWWQIYIDDEGDLKARLRYATRIIPLWQDEEHEILDAVIMTYDVEVYTSATDRGS